MAIGAVLNLPNEVFYCLNGNMFNHRF